MSIAVRRSVPLNSRCSRKCVDPWWPSRSSREPTPTQAPIVADRSPGMRSVRTRTPPGRTERRTRASPSCPADSSLPGSPGGTSGSARGTSGVGACGGGLGLRRGVVGSTGSTVSGRLVDNRVQRQLAARVDLADLDLDLLAHPEDVLDVLHALAADELADLRDVQQTVLARGQR